MSKIPNCNLTFNGKLIYSPNTSNFGNAIGGGLGLIINSFLAVLFLIIYMVTRSTFVLVLLLLSLASVAYSYSISATSVDLNTPSRPCIDSQGVTLE